MVDKTTKKQLGGATGKGFLPGQSGNPNGRPKGMRNKLSEDFIRALSGDFVEHGVSVIEAVRTDKPDAYLKTIASIIPKEHKIDGSIKYERTLTDTELAHEIVALLTGGAESQNNGIGQDSEAFMAAIAGPSDTGTQH